MNSTPQWPACAFAPQTAKGSLLRRCRRRARRAGMTPDLLSFGAGGPPPRLKNEAGEMHVGRVFLSAGVRLWAHKGGVLRIEDNTFLDEGVEIIAWQDVHIGAGCHLGVDALVMDTDLHAVGNKPVRNRPVSIGDGVVIGCRSLILKGVSIGARAVIHPGSVVVRDVPEDGEVAPAFAEAVQ